MKREEIELKVEELLTPYCNENNYEVVDVEYVKEGSDYILRIYCEKEGGITINDCVEISRYVDPLLDNNDFIDNLLNDKKFFQKTNEDEIIADLKNNDNSQFINFLTNQNIQKLID